MIKHEYSQTHKLNGNTHKIRQIEEFSLQKKKYFFSAGLYANNRDLFVKRDFNHFFSLNFAFLKIYA